MARPFNLGHQQFHLVPNTPAAWGRRVAACSHVQRAASQPSPGFTREDVGMCATVPDWARYSCDACVCDGSRTAPNPVKSAGKDTARRVGGFGLNGRGKWEKQGAAYSQSKPQPDCRANSWSHPQKQPKEDITRKDLCWVSPRVLFNLQSCPGEFHIPSLPQLFKKHSSSQLPAMTWPHIKFGCCSPVNLGSWH